MTEIKTPPPFKVCPECGGSGEEDEIGFDGGITGNVIDCENCQGEGTISIHYTPQQWEEYTERKVPDDMPVWYDPFGPAGMPTEWRLSEYGLVCGQNISIVIATEAGRPDKDWRPE